ncbi:hypothetical protein QAD02_014540 [Eretmocerus hayati]|uniref:Uncharacterized protein n=1 Tax=Eretmocerus hayati TaxID=131215 RepID=A0ACC2P6L6_9HYME|nr:hypothetical protein QAD02_014540 [Eretmocerus hayati]
MPLEGTNSQPASEALTLTISTILQSEPACHLSSTRSSIEDQDATRVTSGAENAQSESTRKPQLPDGAFRGTSGSLSMDEPSRHSDGIVNSNGEYHDQHQPEMVALVVDERDREEAKVTKYWDEFLVDLESRTDKFLALSQSVVDVLGKIMADMVMDKKQVYRC